MRASWERNTIASSPHARIRELARSRLPPLLLLDPILERHPDYSRGPFFARLGLLNEAGLVRSFAPGVRVPRVALYAPLLAVEADLERRSRIETALPGIIDRLLHRVGLGPKPAGEGE